MSGSILSRSAGTRFGTFGIRDTRGGNAKLSPCAETVPRVAAFGACS